MASLFDDGSGKWRIEFMMDGRRKGIKRSSMNKKAAGAFFERVEDLIRARKLNTSIDARTLDWLADLPDSTYEQLSRNDLVEPRVKSDAAEGRHPLIPFIDAYITDRTDAK